MKIAVSGKGGVGKTVVAATLADFFVKRDFKVLAIDADPSPNLALTLGIPADQAGKIVPISQNIELIRRKTSTGVEGVYRLSFAVEDIVRDYCVKAPNGVALLVMGTVKSPDSGCTCPANAVVRALLQHLLLERDEIVVMDMEAGVEHMGRGTAKHVDVMLIVVDPSMKSMEIAKQIHDLALGAGIKKIFIIGNKIASLNERRSVEEYVAKNRFSLLEVVPNDKKILQAEIDGNTPLKHAGNSRGLASIQEAGEKLIKLSAIGRLET